MAKKVTKKKTTKKTTKKVTASAAKTGGSSSRSTKVKSTASKAKAAASGTATATTASTKTTKRKVTKKKAPGKTARTTNGTATAPMNGELADNGLQWTDEQLRKVKTGLNKKDMQYFRQLLLEKRVEIIGDVEALRGDARRDSGGISYEHMADVGTDHYEQEFTLGLMESERKLLHQIDEALGRIENGTYGVCLESGQPIGRPRLEAKPWAKYTIEVVREREKRGL